MALPKKGGVEEAITSVKTEDPEVTDKLRNHWNAYNDWLSLKGLKGSPELDKNDLGGKMIDEYRKLFPETSVSRETIIPIQNEFKKYKEWVLNEVKAGRANLTEGTTPETFMKDLSIADGIAGQRTTSFKFPSAYLKTFNNGTLVSNENKGFSTINK